MDIGSENNMNKISRTLKKMFGKKVYVDITTTQGGELLRDKCVVVTGGAEGIGAAIARMCISQGARVLITGRDESKLQNFVNSVERKKISILAWDISDCTVIEEKFEQVLDALGRVDIWINNAGIYRDVDYSSCRTQDWDDIMSTNVRGPYFVTNRVVSYFKDSNIKGTILNIASETGKVACTNPYGFSKNIIMQYTEGLAVELSKYGIRANAIAPGGVATKIAGRTTGDDLSFPAIGGRLITCEEIAEVALFLISPVSMCINGQTIYANEGNTIVIPSGNIY